MQWSITMVCWYCRELGLLTCLFFLSLNVENVCEATSLGGLRGDLMHQTYSLNDQMNKYNDCNSFYKVLNTQPKTIRAIWLYLIYYILFYCIAFVRNISEMHSQTSRAIHARLTNFVCPLTNAEITYTHDFVLLVCLVSLYQINRNKVSSCLCVLFLCVIIYVNIFPSHFVCVVGFMRICPQMPFWFILYAVHFLAAARLPRQSAASHADDHVANEQQHNANDHVHFYAFPEHLTGQMSRRDPKRCGRILQPFRLIDQ